MRNLLALALGVAAIIVAFIVASGTTNRDDAPRPQAAFVMATAFHATPSATPTDTATPRPTFTPGPTPTARHLWDPQPSNQEILALLFQYPQGGSMVTPRPAVVVDRVQVTDDPHDMLIVTGEGAHAIHQGRVAVVAYGAVLMWANDEYVVAFQHVEFGHRNAAVIYSIAPDEGEIRFVFQDVGIDPGSTRELRRYFTLSCSSGRCRVIDSTAGHSI